jgi:antitoxin component YwqK of YwqJK toxin-antitoxin module
MQRIIIYITLVGLLFVGCNEQKPVSPGTLSINITDPGLKLINAVWLYNGVAYNGEIREIYPGGTLKSIQQVKDGKQDGIYATYYPDGNPETRRWYREGEKDGLHTGWWPAGSKRFEYHFNNGNYNGLFTDWYQDGKMLQQILYDNGQQVSGKGWREDGKLFLNFVVKNGRYYGLMNSNLCYSLKDQVVR